MDSPSSTRVGRSPLGDMDRFGDAPALITSDGLLSYRELASRVRDTAGRLGTTRRLVLVEARNDVTSIVAYLAALEGGHPVLLVPGDRPSSDPVDAYDPDVVFAADGRMHERRPGTAHDLHPDLALLLSTSGSTGSPKVVRLSHENLRSNADSIVAALGICGDDRAATTLPMHYCYGLSVVNSHLLSGAGLVLTDLSVADDCFWDLFRRAGATSFAGVPFTFDLLDQCGFADRDLPSLRYVTQAGGRLRADRVAAYADLGRRRGWDLIVMYGQTEATARMAYLPAELVHRYPEAIGIPVAGGSFRLEPGTAELVYRGDNVMMGYATCPADLARGRGADELHTGDLARRLPGGVYEIVGRSSRFAKVFGLRVDLDELERLLADSGHTGRCVEQGNRLHVFVGRHSSVGPVQSLLADRCGLPAHAVRSAELQEDPLTATGKVDYAALERQAQILDRQRVAPTPCGLSAERLRDLYAELLGRPDATVDSTFVGLGGDSLSYVELSVRLGDALGTLPRDWHTTPVRRLAEPAQQRPKRSVVLETTVLLRAVAILLVVGTHANLFSVYGGAHLLLGLAGYNFARFQLEMADRSARLRHGLAAVAQVAVPSMLWIAGVGALTGGYDVSTALLLNGLLGSDTWTLQWQFWFLEALVWTVAVAVLALACPAVHRMERRTPWRFALGVLAFTLALRYGLVGIEAESVHKYTPVVVAWCFALGWVAARATSVRRRLTVALVAVAAVAGFFGEPERELLVIAGFLLLLYVPRVHLPRAATRAVSAVAAASLFVYLTHWQVYPHLEVNHPLLAFVCSVAVGLGVERLARPGLRAMRFLLLNRPSAATRTP